MACSDSLCCGPEKSPSTVISALFGQVECFLKRVCRISGNDIVGGEHNGSGTLTGRVVRIGAAVGETGQHGRTAHYAVAD